MNSSVWRIVAVVCGVIVVVTLGVWVAHGRQTLTKNKVQEVVKTKNPDFGTEEEHIEWKDEFRLGLDIAGPTAGSALLLCLGSVVMMRRLRSDNTSDNTNVSE
jgi:hypothetical protein